MTQAVFYAMVVNEALQLGVLDYSSTKTPFYGSSIVDRPAKEGDPDRRMIKKRTQSQHLRRPRPPQPLLEDYWDLCPSFSLSDTEEAARDFDIPEMIQGTFYAMVRHDRGLEVGSRRSVMAHFRVLVEDEQACPSVLHRQANRGAEPGPVIDQEDDLCSSDAPAPSSGDE
ncbi:hypothetical protein Cgig2_033662 [Carnegiea gigantea]|uniref:Uncharacterized protein n=1 Tax=Carnegiea gigantea TaxID=171969 RepID=A0A9Q1Q952_9CARY|nr:hypothetical protein Cgig2_033662 [Carnegiea gigantea]